MQWLPLTLFGRPARRVPTSFRRDRRGLVALMFAVMALPVIGLVGIAVEYHNLTRVWSRLNLAADSAAMAAATTANKAANAGSSAGDAQAAGVQAGMQYWTAQTQSLGLSSLTLQNNSVTVDPSNGYKATVQYTAQVPTTFGAMFGIKSMRVGNTSQVVMGSGSGAKQLYFLLDTSESMGIAATPDAMNALLAATLASPVNYTVAPYTYETNAVGYAGCQLACHFNNPNYTNQPQGPDFYSLAKYNNIQLRIEVLKQTVVSALTQLKSTAPASSATLWGFDDAVYPIYDAGGSSTLDGAIASASVQDPYMTPTNVSANTNLGCICIERMYRNSSDTNSDHAGNTDLPNALQYAESRLANTTGSNRYLLLITDGVVDNAQGVGPISLSTCTAFRTQMNAAGVQVFVMDITYWPLDSTSSYPASNVPASNGWAPYDNEIAPSYNQFPTNLEACANKYFSASDPASMSSAMQQMLGSAGGSTPVAMFTQ
jgi:Flp pilus assembly protein TadG